MVFFISVISAHWVIFPFWCPLFEFCLYFFLISLAKVLSILFISLANQSSMTLTFFYCFFLFCISFIVALMSVSLHLLEQALELLGREGHTEKNLSGVIYA